MEDVSRSLNVAVITTSFPLRARSVSGIFVRRLVENLPSDLKVTVVTPCDSYPAEPGNEARYALKTFRYGPTRWQVLAHRPGGIPVALKRNPWFLLMLPSFLSSMLVACLRAARLADILHAQWGINGAVACLAGGVTGTPVVTTLQGEDVARTKRSGLDRMLLRWTLQRSAQVVAVAEGQIEIISERMEGLADRVIVIPNAVEPGFLQIQKHAADKPGRLNLLYVGSLIPRKAVDVVLEAVAVASATGSIGLVVAGDGPERMKLEALARDLGLEKSVQFRGLVPAGELPSLLGVADALVLASHSEGLPNVVLEALAAQVPVVASAIPGNIELIRDHETGLLFPTDDVEALAAHLATLRDDPALRRRMGRAGRALIEEKGLTWPEVGRRYAELYRKVLNKT